MLTTTLKALKFPLKLLTRLIGSKQKIPKKTELEQKQLAHVRNFDPTRLKNKSWQIRAGKKPKKRNKNIIKRKQKIWFKAIKN